MRKCEGNTHGHIYIYKIKYECLKGFYYALLQSLDFVLGCTRTCSHAWLFENNIFHINQPKYINTYYFST